MVSHLRVLTTFSVLVSTLVLVLLTTLCQADPADFEKGASLLTGRNFDQKTEGAGIIGTSGDPRAEKTLKALLAGDLYYLKKDNTLVFTKEHEQGYQVTGVLSGEDLGVIGNRDAKKVTINNSLRGQLKTLIASLNLTSKDPEIRLKAVTAMLEDLTADEDKMLTDLQAKETDPAVKDALTTALALTRLKSDDASIRLRALKNLEGNLHPAVRNALTALQQTEQDTAVQKEVKKDLVTLEAKIAWYSRLETIFFGLSLGSVLVLAAIGLAITFGVIGVINMAHGELIMIGAYTTYVIQTLLPNSIGLSILIAVPAAFCVSALVGIVIERSVIRFLYGRPLETLLATFGISLVLQQTVRTIFSPLNRSVATPDWMSGSLVINPVLSLTTNRVTIFFFAMIVFAVLYVLLKKSSIGLQVRAVSQNRNMARAMGVRAAKVDALTFGLGSGIAGIAGVALSQLTNVGPNLGQAYIVDSFMVVVFGGVGNLWGTLLGGLSLGVANKFLEPWSGAVLAKIIILVCIILFIQKRPQGLFPQRGRAAE